MTKAMSTRRIISSMKALPLLRIITSRNQHATESASQMSPANEIPAEPRRKKKHIVPVHTSYKNEGESYVEPSYGTYGEQFNSKKRTKQKSSDRDRHDINNIEETSLDIQRVSKKSLVETNELLCVENRLLNEKINEKEEYFNKKICKLKEKLAVIERFNKDLVKESDIIKTQYNDLLSNYEECKIQLENSKFCKGCEELKVALDKCTASKEILEASNKQLTEDTDMLKNVVYRLNVHLERYQERLQRREAKPKSAGALRTSNESPTNFELITNEAIANLSEEHANHQHIPISWGKVNAHTLGPLLDAYQETISEKEEIIQNYESELSKFTGKLREIMKENESLHRRLTEDDECSAKLIVEVAKLKSELKSTKEENDLLIKKCALKQEKLEEVLHCYEQKIEQLRRDYNVVVDQYHKSRTEVAALKEKNKSLADSQDEFKNERQNYIPIAVHNSSVNECKKWYEELKQQYEQEKLKLNENVISLNNQMRELKNNINILRSEKEELQNKMKNSEKHAKKLEVKHLDLQQALHEVQLSRTACKKQLHKVMEFAKDLVDEQEKLLNALHQRQQENKVVKQIGTDIATRMDSLKNQLKTVQRDAWNELSTVEQRLQDQDSMITSLRREHDEEVERLKQIIKQKETSNLLLRESNSSIPLPHYLLLKDRQTR